MIFSLIALNEKKKKLYCFDVSSIICITRDNQYSHSLENIFTLLSNSRLTIERLKPDTICAAPSTVVIEL